ncbi:MAG TPA: hypothetical protein ENJ31_06035 [Anaerolineae bacterium]|nr:hypothetical protein [Anaerolineae bacterium]
MVIRHLRDAADALRQALDQEDAKAIQDAQEEFSRAVKEAWQLYENGQLVVEMRGLPRLMYFWAVDELPERIQDPAQWLSLRRELGHFLRVMELSIKPQEVA